jgi:hypothetical protein
MPIDGDVGRSTTIATTDYFQNPAKGVGSIAFTVSLEVSAQTPEAYLGDLFPNDTAPEGEIAEKTSSKTSAGYSAATYKLKGRGGYFYKTAVSNGQKVIFFDYSEDVLDTVNTSISSLKIKS